jgi:hypothetical protein
MKHYPPLTPVPYGTERSEVVHLKVDRLEVDSDELYISCVIGGAGAEYKLRVAPLLALLKE